VLIGADASGRNSALKKPGFSRAARARS
jgi:hypothetical protein